MKNYRHFYFEEDSDKGGAGGSADTAAGAGADSADYTEGMTEPDFGKLFRGPATPEPKTEPAKEPEPVKEPAVEPAKAKEPEEQPKPDAAPKQEQPKAKEQEPEPAKAPAEEPEIDLDKQYPEKSMNPVVNKSIRGLKGLVKEAREEAKRFKSEAEALRVESETLKARATEIDPEIAKKIEEADRIVGLFSRTVELKIREQSTKEVEESTGKLHKFLADRSLPADKLESLKKLGDNILDWDLWGDIIRHLDANDPLGAEELRALRVAQRKAVDSRDHAITKLLEDREGFEKEIATRANAVTDGWRSEMYQSFQAAASPHQSWAHPLTIPPTAPPQEKARLEAENKTRQTRAEKAVAYIQGAHARDPKITGEMAFKAVASEYFEAKAKEAEEELSKLRAKASDMEKELLAIKSAGRIRPTEAPSGPPRTSQTIGGDLDEAFNARFGR